MQPDTLEKIFYWFLDNVDEDIEDPHISLLGGETFLCFDLICKIADLTNQAARKNKNIFLKAIPTNGILLDEKVIKILKEKGLTAAFSLDGYSYLSNKYRFKDREAYSKVLENISVYKKLIGIPQIKMTIHPDRAKFMYQDICSFLKEDLTDIQLSPAFGEKWNDIETKSFFDSFLRVLKLHKALKARKQNLCIDPIDEYVQKISKDNWDVSNCGLGNEIVFTPSGDAYACTLVVNLNDKLFRRNFYLGNIHKNNINLKKMVGFKNYRMCSDLKLDCQYCFPDLTCRKLCATFDFKAGRRLDKKNIENLCALEPYMFRQTYQAYFTNVYDTIYKK